MVKLKEGFKPFTIGDLIMSMNEVDGAKKVALKKAKGAIVIYVRVKPEVVIVNRTIRITAYFFSHLCDNLFELDLIDVDHPVVEVVPGLGQRLIIHLEKKDKGVYECDFTPIVTGTQSFVVKEKKDAGIGESVEIEVIDEQTDGFLGNFFEAFKHMVP